MAHAVVYVGIVILLRHFTVALACVNIDHVTCNLSSLSVYIGIQASLIDTNNSLC